MKFEEDNMKRFVFIGDQYRGMSDKSPEEIAKEYKMIVQNLLQWHHPTWGKVETVTLKPRKK
ncbi:MAG: hypothetical protein WCY97_08510 [Methanothrix sp.]|jgi:hypothetical protein|nr:hypothetical protein [Methanothrix harundinacea]MDD2638682.1 hypothetical protein [Methanothrix sp.]